MGPHLGYSCLVLGSALRREARVRKPSPVNACVSTAGRQRAGPVGVAIGARASTHLLCIRRLNHPRSPLQVEGRETLMTSKCRRTYSNAHAYHINTVSLSSDKETFLSGAASFMGWGRWACISHVLGWAESCSVQGRMLSFTMRLPRWRACGLQHLKLTADHLAREGNPHALIAHPPHCVLSRPALATCAPVVLPPTPTHQYHPTTHSR